MTSQSSEKSLKTPTPLFRFRCINRHKSKNRSPSVSKNFPRPHFQRKSTLSTCLVSSKSQNIGVLLGQTHRSGTTFLCPRSQLRTSKKWRSRRSESQPRTSLESRLPQPQCCRAKPAISNRKALQRRSGTLTCSTRKRSRLTSNNLFRKQYSSRDLARLRISCCTQTSTILSRPQLRAHPSRKLPIRRLAMTVKANWLASWCRRLRTST